MLWLHRHAAGLNADPDRITLLGHGLGMVPAGIAMATTCDSYDDGDDPGTRLVLGFAALSGVFDLQPPDMSFPGPLLQIDGAVAATHSPDRLLGSIPGGKPAVWLAVSKNETDKFHRQMYILARAAEAANCPLSARLAPSHNHSSLRAELANPSSLITNALI